MERERARSALGLAMVLLGVLQAAWGFSNGELLFAGFGFAYALLGVGWVRLS